MPGRVLSSECNSPTDTDEHSYAHSVAYLFKFYFDVGKPMLRKNYSTIKKTTSLMLKYLQSDSTYNSYSTKKETISIFDESVKNLQKLEAQQ